MKPAHALETVRTVILKPLLDHPKISLFAIVLIAISAIIPVIYESIDNQPSSGDQLINGQSFTVHNSQQSKSEPPVADDLQLDNSDLHGLDIDPAEADQADLSSALLADHQIEATEPAEPELNHEVLEIQSGDTLDKIFRDRGYTPQLLHQIISLNHDTLALTKLRVGDQLELFSTQENQLAQIKQAVGMDKWLMVHVSDDEVSSEVIERRMLYPQKTASGVIEGNLFADGTRVGISDATLIAMAKIFGWDIDFALDIRKGDRFAVIYEQIWRDDEYLKDGDIIAARFVNKGKVYEALRYVEADGEVEYYSPEGRPMRKAFLRAPLDFTRVSSNFNPARLHPVLKVRRPHNGIDYAAPTGTPVYAAGAGKVIRSDYNRANGHHVFIDHNNGVITRYLHFSKRAVRHGQRVKQGETIGYVGATGLASGPHLHYEFIIDGVHRNPATVKLPGGAPLDNNKLVELKQQHHYTLQQLARLDESLTFEPDTNIAP